MIIGWLVTSVQWPAPTVQELRLLSKVPAHAAIIKLLAKLSICP